MKLSELKLSDFKRIAKEKFDYPNKLIRFLKQNGYKLAGEGASSQVFIKPNSKIAIKISTENDICWLRYVDLVKKHPNKHFMKIGKINQLDEFYIAFIERLHKVKLPDNFAEYIDSWIDLNDPTQSDKIIPSKIISNRTEQEIAAEYKMADELIRKEAKEFEKEYPDLAKAIGLLLPLRDNKCSFDLGVFGSPENIMARDDGTFVIIDPLFYETMF